MSMQPSMQSDKAIGKTAIFLEKKINKYSQNQICVRIQTNIHMDRSTHW